MTLTHVNHRGKTHHSDDPAHLSPKPSHQSLNHTSFPECAQGAHASCVRDGPKPQLPLFPVAAPLLSLKPSRPTTNDRPVPLPLPPCHRDKDNATLLRPCDVAPVALVAPVAPLLLSTSSRPTKNAGPVPPPRQLQCNLLSLPLFPPLLSSMPSMPTTNAGPAPLPLDDAAVTSR